MRALIAAFADPAASPRPRRMVEACLRMGYETHLFTLKPSKDLGVQRVFPISPSHSGWSTVRKIAAVRIGLLYHIVRSRSGRDKMITTAYTLNQADDPFELYQYDIVIIEDLFLLSYCNQRCGDARIIFDAREFYPRQREGSLIFDLLEKPIRNWACKTYLPECDQVFTVSRGLSNEYLSVYGVSAQILLSTPPLQQFAVRETKKTTDEIRIVHLGVANPNRKIENMLDVFRRLDSRFHFDLYLTGNNNYIRKLRRKSARFPRLRVLDPVAPDNIISTLNQYDVGFYYLEPLGFNLKHSLPNKFFEFIQAGLALAIGPSPEMKYLTQKYQCGYIAEAFTTDAMAATLNSITADSLEAAKEASKKAAQELCAEVEWKKLTNILESFSSK